MMKTNAWSLLALFGAVCFASSALATSTPVDVVAERTAAGRDQVAATSEGLTYVLVQAGVISQGDTFAGDKRPDASVLVTQLQQQLAARGWRPIELERGGPPDILLVGHWGVLRNEPTMRVESGPTGMSKPGHQELLQRARLLRGPGSDEVEPTLVAWRTRTVGGPPFTEEGRQLLRAAEDERYFFILAAYDYRSAAEGEVQLLWRTKASRPIRGAFMRPTLEVAARAAADALGNEHAAKPVTVSPGSKPTQLPPSTHLTTTHLGGLGLPQALVERIVREERADTLGIGELPFQDNNVLASAAH